MNTAAEVSRQFRSYSTAEAVVAFAPFTSIGAMSRALVVRAEQVEGICRRAIERGDLQMMPPAENSNAHSALTVELTNLRAALSDAQALIRELRNNEVEAGEEFHRVAGLTTLEAALVSVLVKHRRASKSRIYAAMYGSDPEGGPEPKIIDVLVCKVRAKLKPYGITIETLWGMGYDMTPTNAAKLRALAEPPADMPFVSSPSLVPEAVPC